MAVGPTIKVRRDTTANWASANPTLAAGEIGLDTTLGQFKVGNGSTAWSSLAFYAGDWTSFNGQLAFPASQNASAGANVLDDYEEGTWSPVLTRATTGATFSGYDATGRYTKIGGLVTVTFEISYTGVTDNGSGYNIVTGLPFTPATAYFSGSIGYVDVYSSMVRAIFAYPTAIYLMINTFAILNANYATGTKYFQGTITYSVS